MARNPQRTTDKPIDEARRQRDIERQRKFRRENPEKCREYRQRYYIRAAARLLAAQQGQGGADDAGN